MTSPHTTPGLDVILNGFADARGAREDEEWASTALVLLTLDDVADGAARRELARVLATVRETGEGPADLYGTPRDWVQQVRHDAAEAGEPLVDSTPDSRWRDLPVIGFVLAAGISVLFGIVWLLRDGLTTDHSWGLLLAPGAMGLTGVLVHTVWERLLRRTSRVPATLGAGAALAGAVVLLAWYLTQVNAGTVLFTGSTFWLFALAPAYGALAWVFERVLPETGRARGAAGSGRTPRSAGADDDIAPLSDDAWAGEVAGTLRLRLDLPEARVREIVREARAHGAASGRPLAEEFGTPQRYASRFPRDTAAARRRTAWFQTGLMALVLVVVASTAASGESVPWWHWAWLALAAWLAVQAWRRRD